MFLAAVRVDMAKDIQWKKNSNPTRWSARSTTFSWRGLTYKANHFWFISKDMAFVGAEFIELWFGGFWGRLDVLEEDIKLSPSQVGPIL